MDEPSQRKNAATALDEFDSIPVHIRKNVECFHDFLESENVAPGALKHQLATLFWRMQLDSTLQNLVMNEDYEKARNHLDTHTMPMPLMGIHVKLDALGYIVRDAGDTLILMSADKDRSASITIPEDPLGSARLAVDLAAYTIIHKHVGTAHAPQPLYNKASRVVRFNTWATSEGEFELAEHFDQYILFCQSGVVADEKMFEKFERLRPPMRPSRDRYVETNTTMIDTESELQLPKKGKVRIHAGDADDMVSAKELKALSELALRAKTDLLITTDKRISSRMETRLQEAGFEAGEGGYFSVISDKKGRFAGKLVPGPEDEHLVAKIITFIEENGHLTLTAGESVEAKSRGKAWKPKAKPEFVNPNRISSAILTPNKRLYNFAPPMSEWFLAQCAILFSLRPGAYETPKAAAEAYEQAKNGNDTIPSWAHRALNQAVRKLRLAQLQGDATAAYARALEIFAQLTPEANEALLCYISSRRHTWNPRWYRTTFLPENLLEDQPYESMRSGVVVVEALHPIHRHGGPLPIDRRITPEPPMPLSVPIDVPFGEFQTPLSATGMAIGFTRAGTIRTAEIRDETKFVANTQLLRADINERNT